MDGFDLDGPKNRILETIFFFYLCFTIGSKPFFNLALKIVYTWPRFDEIKIVKYFGRKNMQMRIQKIFRPMIVTFRFLHEVKWHTDCNAASKRCGLCQTHWTGLHKTCSIIQFMETHFWLQMIKRSKYFNPIQLRSFWSVKEVPILIHFSYESWHLQLKFETSVRSPKLMVWPQEVSEVTKVKRKKKS